MSWKVLREEWGAAVFVVTVLVGLVAVPIAFSVRQPPTVSSGFEAAPTPPPLASEASTASQASTATP